MIWQDTVIAICQAGFIVAFIPTLRSHHKPAAVTSLMNGLLVGIITFCLLTLKLWFATITAGIVGILWFVVWVQKIKLDKQKVIK